MVPPFVQIGDDYVDRLPIEGAMRVLEKHLRPKPTFVSMVVTRPMKRAVRKVPPPRRHTRPPALPPSSPGRVCVPAAPNRAVPFLTLRTLRNTAPSALQLGKTATAHLDPPPRRLFMPPDAATCQADHGLRCGGLQMFLLPLCLTPP